MKPWIRVLAWRLMKLQSLAPRKPLFGPGAAWVFERIGDLVEEWTGVFVW